MANFPVFHGIKMAANSWVENFHVETLTSDPSPIAAGRLWYNSTSKVLKFSTLNSSGAVVVGVITDTASVQDAIDSLTSSLGAETTARENAIGAVEDRLDTLEGDATVAGSVAKAQADATASANSYTDTAISNLIDGAPALLNTLNELAAALQDNPNVLTALDTTVGQIRTDFEAADSALDGRLDVLEGSDTTAGSVAKALKDANDYTDGEISSLSSSLGTDISDIDGRLTTVEGEVNGKIGTLANLTTTEKGTLVGAINELDSGLSGLGNDIGSLGSLTTGTTSSIVGAINSVQSAVTGLDSDLGSLDTRVGTAEGNISSIQGDISSIQSAATTLAGRVTTAEGDITSLEGRMTTAEGDIDAVESRVTTTESDISGIQSDVGTLSSLSTSAKNSLVAAINELDSDLATEITNRGTAVSDAISSAATYTDTEVSSVRSDYNATIFTYQSNSAATTHTITHNLNSGFVAVDVMVEGTDGTYRNDYVSVEETDQNQVKVYLSVSRRVKVICRNAATI
jgi:hypothetical protein